ncbi:unnamed protein product, partial [Didymodactylos carnosus]
KSGRKRKSKDYELILNVNISSFIEKDETLKDEDYITKLTTFVISVCKEKNLNCIESSVRKEVVNQLALLRSEHKKNCRKTKKRASDSWSSKIIHINLEIPLDLLFSAPVLFDDAYIFKLPDNDVPKLCMTTDDNDDNTNDSQNIHFMKNSSVEIISENIVQVIIEKDLIRRIIPNNQFSDEKMIINFIRAIKNQMMELNISEDRISSSSIRRA